MHHPSLRLVSSLFTLTLAACGGAATDADRADAEAAATATTGVAESTQASGWFTATGPLQGVAAVTVDQARPLALQSVVDEIKADVAAPTCVAITSDQSTYVMATFTDCGVAGRTLSGSIKGTLGFDTVACGPAMCPTALRWDIDAALTWSSGAELTGAWTVVAPLDQAQPRTLTGGSTATSPSGAVGDGDVLASWTKDASDCVTASGSVTMSGARTGTVTITGLAACPGACPAAGTVSFGGARGTLSFAFDGSASVTVTAGTRTFALPLACGG